MSPVVLALTLGSSAGALPRVVQATNLQPFPVVTVDFLRMIPSTLVAAVALLGALRTLLLLGLATTFAAAALSSAALVV